MRKLLFLSLFALFITGACKKKETEREKMDKYIADHNLKGEYTPSGLYVVIDSLGTGGHPNINSKVKVEYTGYLLNGSVFDGTKPGKPIEFYLNQVIDGWQEGIPKFQKGGKGKLIIPSQLGYGSYSQSGIPANSVLVFDIYLVDWK